MKFQCLRSVNPPETELKAQRCSGCSQGRAHGVSTRCLLLCPSALSNAREQAWGQEHRAQYCLSQGSAKSSGLCCFSPVSPQPQEGTDVLVPPLEHAVDCWTPLYTSTDVKVSQAGLCPRTTGSSGAGSLTQNQTTTAGMIKACQERDRAE